MNLNITEKRSELMGGRDSNLELFRILSMLVIVAHHYVVNSGLLECIDAQTKITTERLLFAPIWLGRQDWYQLLCFDYWIFYVHISYYKTEIL